VRFTMGRPRTSLCCSVLARKTIHRTSEEVWSCSSVNGQPVRFFRFFSFARFSFASALRIASFGTVSTIRSALLIRSASVLPGTDGAGSGFMLCATP
jgi:hypothetical protein